MPQADTGTPDEILVVAAILGDLSAFDVLVLRYRAAVIRTARLIVSRDEVEDVTQEAFLLAFKALPSLEEPAKFPAWLHAIARRCAFRVSESSRARQRVHQALDEAILEQVPALSCPLPGDHGEEDLLDALAVIPRDYALVLRLHYLDEMPLKRIAGYLGVSLATVKWRTHRGRKMLRDQLEAMRRSNEKWKKTQK